MVVLRVTAILATVLLQLAWAEHMFDYVIVGGGTCGLLLAKRLSEDSNNQVAVIEPGGDVRNNPAVTVISSWTENQDSPIDWDYKSVAQQHADNRVLTYHAGKAIGGTSTMNGMTYIRGDKAEFEAWEQLGNHGFTWDNMFERMKATENFKRPDDWQIDLGATYDMDFHGRNGEIDVSFVKDLDTTSFFKVVNETWASLGYSKIQDVNGGSVRGFSVWPHTVNYTANTRSDSASAFYWGQSVFARPNLQILEGTVRKIKWLDVDLAKPNKGNLHRAKSVEFVDTDGKLSTVGIRKEVILSAGSLRTPPILELSGVGNPSLLERLAIPVKISLPGVGENLQDQLKQNLSYRSHIDVPGITPYVTYMTAWDLWGNKTKDIASNTQALLGTWAARLASRKDNGLAASQIQELLTIQHNLIFQQNVSIGEIMTLGHGTRLLSVFWALLPFSRGSVHLTSATENFESPLIDPGFLEIEFDLAMQVSVGKLTQKYYQTKPVSSSIIENLVPGEQTLPKDAQEHVWADFVRNEFISNSHQIGTASMMARDTGGVVDSQFRVYGTQNVRVVDASVVPIHISGHLTPALYALAERAARSILAETPAKIRT